MDIREVYSAYASIYEDKVQEEYLDEDLDFIDDLSDEELDEIVDEMVEAYIEEGYDLDELEQIFAEYLEEAKVTYGHDSGGESDDDMVSQVRKKKAEASKKRADRVEKIKKSISDTIKTKVASVKKSVKDKAKEIQKIPRDKKAWAHQPLVDYAARATPTSKDEKAIKKKTAFKGRGIFPSKPDKDGKSKTKLDRGGITSKIAGATLPKNAKTARKQLRGIVVQDLKSRAKAKVEKAKKAITTPVKRAVTHHKAKAAVKDYNLKRDAEAKSKLGGPTSVKGVWTRRGEAAKKVVDKVTAAPKKAVKAVRNKTASALSSLADKIKTEGIELDAFDTVVAYLIDEGFATDFDHAQKIMSTLDSQLIEEVHQQQLEFVEAYLVTNADREGNTPAWRGYKKGKKNVKTGEPLYKAADHLKDEKK